MRVLGLSAPSNEPVVVASARLARRWPRLRGVIPEAVSKRSIEGEDVVIVGRLAPVAVVRDGRSAVVGSIETATATSHARDVRLMLEAFDVGLVDEWRASRIRARVGGDMVIFTRDAPAEAAPLSLEKGELEIHLGRGRREVRLYPHRSVSVEYHAVCLGPRPDGKRPRPPDEPAPPIAATRALERDAARAHFIPARHGQMILLPASLLASWEGVPSVHEKGPRPYHDAQKVKDAGVIAVDAREALVLDPHEAVGVCPRPDGLLLVAWRGAHSEPAAVIAGLTVPEELWRTVGRFHAVERQMVMLDSGVAGRKLDAWDKVEVTLPSTGTYEVGSVGLYGASVARGGRLEVASISAVRLRKTR